MVATTPSGSFELKYAVSVKLNHIEFQRLSIFKNVKISQYFLYWSHGERVIFGYIELNKIYHLNQFNRFFKNVATKIFKTTYGTHIICPLGGAAPKNDFWTD